MDNYEIGLTLFNSLKLTAKSRRTIIKLCKDLEPFSFRSKQSTKNVLNFNLSIVDFDNWFPLIKNSESELHDNFSVYILLSEKLNLLNFMGFNVYSNNSYLNDIFKKYKNLDRNKINYMDLQSELFESGFGNSATFDFETIQKLNKLYKFSKS